MWKNVNPCSRNMRDVKPPLAVRFIVHWSIFGVNPSLPHPILSWVIDESDYIL